MYSCEAVTEKALDPEVLHILQWIHHDSENGVPQCVEVPSVISKQSGCGEILDKCIKTDYWDIHSMADAIYSLCHYDALHDYLSEEGKKEVNNITWEKVGERIRNCYDRLLNS